MGALDWNRRDVLKLGTVALVDGVATGCRHSGPPPVVPPQIGPAFVVDPHCHNFNANDIPVAGFIEHFLAGEGWPDLVVSILKVPLLALQVAAQTSATLAGGGANESDDLMRRLTGEQPAAAALPSLGARHRRGADRSQNQPPGAGGGIPRRRWPPRSDQPQLPAAGRVLRGPSVTDLARGA